jgi:glucose-1-phosphate cytidylyltransferase
MVAEFTEKPQIGEGWVNGGFLVLEAGIFDYLSGDATSLEVDTMERLAKEGQLAAYRHEGFWQCVDTLRDLRLLQSLWSGGAPPWRVWA